MPASNIIYLDDYIDNEPRITEDNPLIQGMSDEEVRQAALRLFDIMKSRKAQEGEAE